MTLQTITTSITNIPSPVNWTTDNRYINPYAGEDSEISFLSKALDGRVTLNDIGDALEEYKRLYKAGIASTAEVLTLSRAYPDSKIYSKALSKISWRFLPPGLYSSFIVVLSLIISLIKSYKL